MDTSTNPRLPRMNVRPFLLAAMSVFFGLLWSSDQAYQDRELGSARAGDKLTAEQPIVAANRPIVQQENVVPVAPFAASSWIAPSFATAAAEDAMREPVVAQRNTAIVPARPAPQEAVVSVIVVIRKPSFHVDDFGIVDTVGQADAASGWPLLEANCQALSRWIDEVRFEISGETCDMRWQLRRKASSAGRRVLAIVRRKIGTETDWRILVQKFARGGFGPFDSTEMDAAAKHAAAPGAADER
jgi:hypothetical protein